MVSVTPTNSKVLGSKSVSLLARQCLTAASTSVDGCAASTGVVAHRCFSLNCSFDVDGRVDAMPRNSYHFVNLLIFALTVHF